MDSRRGTTVRRHRSRPDLRGPPPSDRPRGREEPARDSLVLRSLASGPRLLCTTGWTPRWGRVRRIATAYVVLSRPRCRAPAFRQQDTPMQFGQPFPGTAGPVRLIYCLVWGFQHERRIAISIPSRVGRPLPTDHRSGKTRDRMGDRTVRRNRHPPSDVVAIEPCLANPS